MAGGSGTRMGAAMPKQFIEIGGKAILQHTIEKFLTACPDIRTVVVLPEAWIPQWREYCYSHNFICSQTLVKGGITRFHSVRNGLSRIPDGAVVAVHDAVRPLVSPGLVRKLFSAAASVPAIVPVVPSVDTMKVIDKVGKEDGSCILKRAEGEDVDRERLFGIQTPQIFHSELLKEAYTQAFDPKFTDDGSVAESAGIKITYLEGERYNLKITTPDDLVIAGALLKAD